MNVLKNESIAIESLFWLMVKATVVLALGAFAVLAITPILTIFLVAAAFITISIGIYDRLFPD